MTEYIPHVISQRIHSFSRGLYPRTKKNILKEIVIYDYREVMNEQKENEDAFLYLDPPYMDSFNGGYTSFQTTYYNEDLPINDKTEMYIFFTRIFKKFQRGRE